MSPKANLVITNGEHAIVSVDGEPITDECYHRWRHLVSDEWALELSKGMSIVFPLSVMTPSLFPLVRQVRRFTESFGKL